MTGPRERLVENVTSATALIVVGLGILAFALSVPYFWLVFVVGLFVVVPLVGLLFGAEDWRKWDPLSDEFWEDLFGEEGETETDPDEQPTDSLQTLRDRYARGELTDEQFERKIALLLETESIEDVEDRMRAREPSAERLRERE